MRCELHNLESINVLFNFVTFAEYLKERKNMYVCLDRMFGKLFVNIRVRSK